VPHGKKNVPKSTFCVDKMRHMALYYCRKVCHVAHLTTNNTRTMIVAIHKNTPEGRALTAAAELVGIDASDLLAGICINATRRARRTAAAYQQPAAPTQQPAPVPEPPQPKAAPSSGMFDLA
jgi:Fe-S-cluster-containing dehydrogenase component